MARMHVNAAALNVRAKPDMTSNNVIATLPFGHPLDTTGEHDLKRWIPVKAELNGKTHVGFVNVGYLRDPLSVAKENLLANAAKAWAAKTWADKDQNFTTLTHGFAEVPVKTAKPAIGDVICAVGHDLVVARGLTQVWALGHDLRIVKYPLLEDGRIDNQHGEVTAVLRNPA